MYTFFAILLLLVLLCYLILNVPAFGVLPAGTRLNRIKGLPNYKGGEIQNSSPTPMKPADVSYLAMFKEVLKKNPHKSPQQAIPNRAPDFSAIAGIKVIWFGHSSYFLNLDGVKVLVDPVFSERTSPFAFLGTKSFKGTNFINAEDFPDLDIILITHDHYDHLDYKSILKLKDRTKLFITSLGVGAHLERWGIAPEKIKELAWGEAAQTDGLSFIATPARHFTGRKFKRNQTVWSAFVLKTPKGNLYLGGDSGYDTHFAEVGDKYGPFELAILECGQYNHFWPLIHMFPEQTVQAAKDLKAKVLLPVHWGKFTLAAHNWDDPILRVVKAAAESQQLIATPLQGESVVIGATYPIRQWWLEVDAQL
ncbi:L-ascorbate metabolism protein UlaG (beta-lactamase superfamily) [Pedobacter sp. UYP24]